MRYAVMADLHGKRKALRRVLTAAAEAGVDEVICLGDYLEARVPRSRHDPTRHWPFDEVVDPDPELWAELAGVRRILGNQEERIRDLLSPDQVPELLAPLLSGASMTQVDAAVGMHGHQIGWDFDEESDLFFPRLQDVPAVPLLFVGHTHRRAVFEIRRADDGQPPLDGSSGGSVGSPAPGRTVRSVPVRTGVPVPVRAPASAGITFVVNVGPAIGRPSNWVFFDADRGEVIFEQS